MILSFLLFCHLGFAQNNYDNQVNDHLIESSKKMEIDQQKTRVELERDRPGYLEYNPPRQKKSAPFVVEPPKQKIDPDIIREQQFSPGTEDDPSAQIEQDMQTQRDLANEQNKTRQEYIREFEENAAKAGVKVKVDPNTLEAKPVK